MTSRTSPPATQPRRLPLVRAAGLMSLLLGLLLALGLASVEAQDAPSIATLNPISGPISGGTSVTITGDHFIGATSVTFGGTPAGFAVQSDGVIVATSPAHVAGLVDVAVTTPDGTSANTADDDFTYIAAGVIVTESGGSTNVTEGGATDTYTVVLIAAPTSNVTLTVTDSAQLDATHTLSGGGFGAVPPFAIAVTVLDNDPAVVSLVIDPDGGLDVSESGTTDTYTVELSDQPSGSVVVTITTGGQTTTSPSQLVFSVNDWDDPQTVTVFAVDDGITEGDHADLISHSALGGGFSGAPTATIVVVIRDNDARGVLISGAGGATTLEFTPIDDAFVRESRPNDNYGSAAELEADGTPVKEILLKFQVSGLQGRALTGATLRLYVLNGSGGGGSLFRASSDAWTEATVTWNTAPATSGGAVDTLGRVDEGTFVEFDLTGLQLSDGILSLRIRANSTNRVEYASKEHGNASFAPRLILRTADVPAPTVSEGGAEATYTLVLTAQPSGPVSISLFPDAELTTVPSVLSFNTITWNVPLIVRVRAVDDGDVEGTHTGRIRHVASGGGYGGIAIPDLQVTILDNDAPGVRIVESGGFTRVGEDGLSDSYTIVLTSRPTTTVVVTIDADDDLDVFPLRASFTGANWNQPQTIFVEAIDDSEVEGQESGRIRHAVTGGAFAGVAVADVVVTIIDDDRVAVIQLPRGLELVGWFGAPTTSHAILAGNRLILRIWGWDFRLARWVVDDPLLPPLLRGNFTITLGRGFFVVTSAATQLEVPLG